jgi:hypothetical protein
MRLVRIVFAGVCLAVALTATGCLRKDVTSTWYVERDLSVVWSVLEHDVRSDDSEAEQRQRDEAEFVAEARQHNQPVARGLRQLNPTKVQTTLLRDKPPFTAETVATFQDLRVLGERILGRFGLTGYSSVEPTSNGHQWTWSIDPEARVVEDGLDDDLMALFGSDVVRVALAHGEFLETPGVELSEDHRIATFPLRDILDGLDTKTGDRPTTFVLRWKDR